MAVVTLLSWMIAAVRGWRWAAAVE